jgi:hypothetical protein
MSPPVATPSASASIALGELDLLGLGQLRQRLREHGGIDVHRRRAGLVGCRLHVLGEGLRVALAQL